MPGRGTRWVACAVGLFAVLSAPAPALPGDPGIAQQEPADGATLAVNADGIDVRFTCPSYSSAPATPPFTMPFAGLISDYGAGMSSSPALGSDGRLATRDGIGSATEVTPGMCQSRLGSGGFPKPQATPGTWYWQAWRTCLGCASGYEVSAVRGFVLRTTAAPRLTVQSRAFAGYPIAAKVSFDGASRLTIERLAAGKWTAVAVVNAADRATIFSLPRGRQQLRATAQIGDQAQSSPVARVTVARASKWTTSARDDGRYRDAKRPSVRFRVAGSGRRLTGFHAEVPTICSSTTSTTGTIPNVSTVELSAIRLAPDGRFAVAATYKSIRVHFTGRLRHRALTGARVAIRTSTCSGSTAVQARRAG